MAGKSVAGAVINELLSAAVGREEFDLTGLTEVYDPREDRWRQVAPMPQAQAGLAAAAVGGKLYAFDGEAIFTDNDGVFAQAWGYDPQADAWAQLPDMPVARHGHGAAAIGDHIDLIGGAMRPGGQDRSPLNAVFTPNA
ncbi:MAG: kelch repeat-containing protein [Pseudomonadota bacterium]